jgi:hypothetical protein
MAEQYCPRNGRTVIGAGLAAGAPFPASTIASPRQSNANSFFKVNSPGLLHNGAKRLRNEPSSRADF